jgi:acetyl-CoA carboxylase alpha subunit
MHRLNVGMVPPKGDGLRIAQRLLKLGGQFVLPHGRS